MATKRLSKRAKAEVDRRGLHHTLLNQSREASEPTRRTLDFSLQETYRLFDLLLSNIEMIEHIHHEQFIRHDESETESMGDQADISKAIQGVHDRLDTLKSINEANILLPGGPQEHNPQLVKEAYVVLGSIETEVEHSERSLNSNASVWKVQQMEL